MDASSTTSAPHTTRRHVAVDQIHVTHVAVPLALVRLRPQVDRSSLPQATQHVGTHCMHGSHAAGVPAGALTQLLEDEYDFVRCEALRAVASLSLRSRELAALSWELLATQLYDDVPAVRVAALAAMRVVHGAFQDVPDAVCRAARDALDDTDSGVRLAAVRCAPSPPRRKVTPSPIPKHQCAAASIRWLSSHKQHRRGMATDAYVLAAPALCTRLSSGHAAERSTVTGTAVSVLLCGHRTSAVPYVADTTWHSGSLAAVSAAAVRQMRCGCFCLLQDHAACGTVRRLWTCMHAVDLETSETLTLHACSGPSVAGPPRHHLHGKPELLPHAPEPRCMSPGQWHHA